MLAFTTWTRRLAFGVLVAGWAASPTWAQTKITSTGVNYGSVVTVKGAPLDQERFVASQELMGIRLDDTGKGPFHNVATHIALIAYVDKEGAKVRGFETHTDKDGDKVIWEISAADDPQQPGTQKGHGTVIGATGKFTGLAGTMDFVVQVTKGFPDGTFRTTCKESMKLTAKGAM